MIILPLLINCAYLCDNHTDTLADIKVPLKKKQLLIYIFFLKTSKTITIFFQIVISNK